MKEAVQINALAVAHALTAIRKQKEAGAVNKFEQERNAAIVAYVIGELLVEEGILDPTSKEDAKEVIRAAMKTGPLMQGSTLQKAAVKAGIYVESEAKTIKSIYAV